MSCVPAKRSSCFCSSIHPSEHTWVHTCQLVIKSGVQQLPAEPLTVPGVLSSAMQRHGRGSACFRCLCGGKQCNTCRAAEPRLILPPSAALLNSLHALPLWRNA